MNERQCDFDNDRQYRNPAAWKKAKRALCTDRNELYGSCHRHEDKLRVAENWQAKISHTPSGYYRGHASKGDTAEQAIGNAVANFRRYLPGAGTGGDCGRRIPGEADARAGVL